MSKGGVWRVLHVPAVFDPSHHLVTSPVLPPVALAAIRLTIAVYTLIDFVFDLAWLGTTVPKDAPKSSQVGGEFSYFTSLSFIGIIAYFWASGVQSFFYVRSKQTGYPLQKWPRILQFAHLVLYATITTYPILTTIVFWSLLSDSDTFATKFSAWSNISEHLLNSVYALFEILLTNVPAAPWIHLFFVDFMLGCYLALAYVTHATQGWYPYSFLDPQKEGKLLAGYIIGIAVGETVIFIIVRYICVLREWFVRRKQHVPEPDVPAEALDEWEEVDHSETGIAV